jgi:hypothetical protein
MRAIGLPSWRAICAAWGGSPSNKTGDFVEKVRAVADYSGKLELLNRGQRWVIRKIEEQLPTLSDEQTQGDAQRDGQGA